MDHYTGFEYLCIDIANQFDLDKELFPNRIQWVLENINRLEYLASPKKTRPLYLKAVMAVRKAQRGLATGHLVGLDACCSGMQIMSALTGCVAGCMATNLISTGIRQDAYGRITDEMTQLLNAIVAVARSDAKNAEMTHLYGSKAEPRKLFGEDTAELIAFHDANEIVCPGANELLRDLLNTWNSYALSHEWILPDNYHAFVKVMQKDEKRIEVDELDHASFTYEFYVNAGSKMDVKNAANVIHSIDAYVLRSMARRCDYDSIVVMHAIDCLEIERENRILGMTAREVTEATKSHHVYMERFASTEMPDAVIFPWLNSHSVHDLSDMHIEKLIKLASSMLEHKPFELVTVHDEFKCHANNVNFMRQHYIDIFAEMAKSRLLKDIFLQMTGHECHYANAHPGIADMIRGSEYALS